LQNKTRLLSQKGLFKFEVLPFGLSNAVSAFQRTMEVVVARIPNVKVYLDDILNLKIKPSKCNFAKRETKFLGFDIGSDGIKPCREKLIAMINYPVPKNQKQVKRFLGMA
jgi:hypothetical protein